MEPGRDAVESVVLPGFHDSHLHLRAAAAARLSVDLSAVSTVPALLESLRTGAGDLEGRWIRGWGWDESTLQERRAPTVAEIDSVTASRPCALHHRTGKLVILNSAARRVLARSAQTPVPLDEVVRADAAFLRDMPRQPEGTLESALADLSRELAAAGVTSVTDATATNTWDDIQHLRDWVRRGVVRQRVNALVAFDQVSSTGGLRGDSASDDGVRVLGAKVAAPADGIAERVRHVRGCGWPVAIHATEPDEIEAALTAISECGPPAWGRDRIEHLGLPLPGHLERIRDAGIAVTTNPAFLSERGQKYRESLSPVEQDWLYPVRSVLAHGIPLAAASDRPVTAATPLSTMADAVHRRPRSGEGEPLSRHERVAPDEALALVTDRAQVDGPALDRGRGRGAAWPDLHLSADLVVLSEDPRLLSEECEVLGTFVGGRAIWGGEDPAE
nr:amidohydrolase family protein [Microbacterium sp.]